MRTYNGFELPRVLVPSIAEQLGITRARIRSEVGRGSWQVIARGVVLTRPDEPDRADWAAVGVALAGPTAALSGWDAARCHRVAPREPPSGQVLVLSRHASNRIVGEVRIRETAIPYTARIQPADGSEYPLTPVVTAARAVTDTALLYPGAEPVRAMVTRAIQRRAVQLPDLVTQAACVPRNRSKGLRLALADAVSGAHSVVEAHAGRRLRHGGLAPFEQNAAIRDDLGQLVAVADILWRGLRAILEIDSREYHFSERDWKATMTRHNTLTRLGYAVTHYPPSVVMGRSTAWVDEVRQWLDQRRVVAP